MTVGEAKDPFTEGIADLAASRKVGYGLDEATEMGPVITRESKQRIEGLIEVGAQEGARVLVDGRQKSVAGYDDGYWVFPTVLDGVEPTSQIARTEIFGPVLSLMHADTIEDAIALINDRSVSAYGNMACLFTSSGAWRAVPPRGRLRQYWHKHRRGRTDGLLSIQRLEREFLRRSPRAEPARD